MGRQLPATFSLEDWFLSGWLSSLEGSLVTIDSAICILLGVISTLVCVIFLLFSNDWQISNGFSIDFTGAIRWTCDSFSYLITCCFTGGLIEVSGLVDVSGSSATLTSDDTLILRAPIFLLSTIFLVLTLESVQLCTGDCFGLF